MSSSGPSPPTRSRKDMLRSALKAFKFGKDKEHEGTPNSQERIRTSVESTTTNTTHTSQSSGAKHKEIVVNYPDTFFETISSPLNKPLPIPYKPIRGPIPRKAIQGHREQPPDADSNPALSRFVFDTQHHFLTEKERHVLRLLRDVDRPSLIRPLLDESCMLLVKWKDLGSIQQVQQMIWTLPEHEKHMLAKDLNFFLSDAARRIVRHLIMYEDLNVTATARDWRCLGTAEDDGTSIAEVKNTYVGMDEPPEERPSGLRGGGLDVGPSGKAYLDWVRRPGRPERLEDEQRVPSALWWLAGGNIRHGKHIPTAGELRHRRHAEMDNRKAVGFVGTLFGRRIVPKLPAKTDGEPGGDEVGEPSVAEEKPSGEVAADSLVADENDGNAQGAKNEPSAQQKILNPEESIVIPPATPSERDLPQEAGSTPETANRLPEAETLVDVTEIDDAIADALQAAESDDGSKAGLGIAEATEITIPALEPDVKTSGELDSGTDEATAKELAHLKVVEAAEAKDDQ